jgi:hypothetical protein
MLTTILGLAAANGAVPAQPPAADPRSLSVAPVCRTVSAHPAGAVAKTPVPAPHALGQEPPADEIAAMLYTEGGCIKPVVVREDVGASPVAPHVKPRLQ